MSLPVDPTTIDPEAYGEMRTVLEMDHDEAVEHVREVFTDAGFGVPVEFSPSELLNEKVDADRAPYYVLGACNPAIADRVLDAAMEMGGLFPCGVVVWEKTPGRQVVYHVSIMKIGHLLGIAPDDEEWQAIVDETGEMVDLAFENL
ncbi:DUF302 domain-containing protein [Natribaculum luteum]|uniref:DUF302 domain-containing protein n=1 Tax=Natribaculum luteum TaxID=1586232 RepID=A0ABD5NTM8_9EURY|nr:DUF302 domain-containing protein [Natribaculum luteum]